MGYCLGAPSLESLYAQDRVSRLGLWSLRNEVPSVPKGSIHRLAQLKSFNASADPMRTGASRSRRDGIALCLRRKVTCEIVHKSSAPATDRRGTPIDLLPPEVGSIVDGVWRIVPADERTSGHDGYVEKAVLQYEQNLIWSLEAGELPRGRNQPTSNGG